MVAHSSGTAGNFFSSFCRGALGGKSCQKGCVLSRGGLTAHNLVDYSIRLVIG